MNNLRFGGLLALVLLIQACTPKTTKLVIGSKDFTEQIILAHIIAETAERNLGIQVVRKLNLGGTLVCYGALQKGDLDIYPEYTGTLLKTVLKQARSGSPQAIHEFVKNWVHDTDQFLLMPPLGFNNTYALMMRSDMAIQKAIQKISDLGPHAQGLRAAFTAEFLEREDGFPGLGRTYLLPFSNPRQMAPGLMYSAVAEGKVDVISGFTTDGRVKAFALRALLDDRNFFPPYQACLLARESALASNPGLEAVLLKLSGQLDNDTMSGLNAAVDVGHEDPRQVAIRFLKSRGIIGG